MRGSTRLIRWRVAPAIQPRSGQITIFFTLLLTAALGMVGLAVDVGHAYERRQFVQAAANNAARAGAFEVYTDHINPPTSVASPATINQVEDSAVVERMVDTLANSGLTVKNINITVVSHARITTTLTTLTPPPGSPCGQNLPFNQVYLQAVYIDGSTPPVSITDSSHNPVQVGIGVFPTAAGGYSADAQGVQVTQLVMCVPHFFVGVLHYANFNVGSNAFLSVSGLAETHTSTSSTGIAPFYIFARACQDTSPPSLPTCEQDPYSLYMPGAPDSRGSSAYGITYHASPPISSCPTSPCSGDLVTLHDHSNGSGNWDAWQFVTPSAGMANVPSPALPLGSGSNRGCLAPNATNITFGVWSFNQPGNGAHCGTPPQLGSYVVVPLVDYVCKNDACGTSPTNDPTHTISACTTGGFCVRIIGFVQVLITQDLTTGKLVQGYITDVLLDPYCTVETPIGQHPLPPTASPSTTSPPAIYAPSAYGGSGSTWPTCPNAAS